MEFELYVILSGGMVRFLKNTLNAIIAGEGCRMTKVSAGWTHGFLHHNALSYKKVDPKPHRIFTEAEKTAARTRLACTLVYVMHH